MVDGFKTGHGVELMKGGARYLGEFKNGHFQGSGEIIWPHGNRLTGNWRDSKLQGAGTFHRNDGESFQVIQDETGVRRQ